MIITSIVMLPNIMNFIKRIMAAHFAKQNTKFGGGESESEQKFLPPNPLLSSAAFRAAESIGKIPESLILVPRVGVEPTRA